MNIHLAGLEKTGFITSVGLSGHKYGLLSYFHMNRNPEKERRRCIDLINEFDLDVIVDSGLFTMMFGAGKGKAYDMAAMVEYTKKYIEEVSAYGLKKFRVVECDVHKILGMKEVFELRKHFKGAGIETIYVWHKQEGIDGLLALADEAYIALSVPELRILFKQSESQYQAGVFNLLSKLKRHRGALPMPKVHLLGNTVEITMRTSVAFSCDSTSWLAGVRYGQAIVYRDKRLIKAHIRSELFKTMIESVKKDHPGAFEKIFALSTTEKMKKYLVNTFISAESFRRYQEFLNSSFQWRA